MARADLALPIAALSGKLSLNERIILRTRNGKTHAYIIDKPFRGERTDKQKAHSNSFYSAVAQASVILRDPAQRADWQQRFNQYTERVTRHPTTHPHPCTTLRGFIISTLTKQSAPDAENNTEL